MARNLLACAVRTYFAMMHPESGYARAFTSRPRGMLRCKLWAMYGPVNRCPCCGAVPETGPLRLSVEVNARRLRAYLRALGFVGIHIETLPFAQGRSLVVYATDEG